jgi:hypothetical protein
LGDGDFLLETSHDPRKKHLLQGSEQGGVGKDPGPKSAPIDGSLLIKHFGSETLNHPRHDIGLSQTFMAKLVAGDHPSAMAGEYCGYQALATADPANQAHNRFPISDFRFPIVRNSRCHGQVLKSAIENLKSAIP